VGEVFVAPGTDGVRDTEADEHHVDVVDEEVEDAAAGERLVGQPGRPARRGAAAAKQGMVDTAEFAGLDGIDQGSVCGDETQNLGRHEDLAGGLGGVHHAGGFRGVERHRLFNQDMFAVFECFDSDGRVEVGGQAEINGVDTIHADAGEGVFELGGGRDVESGAGNIEVPADVREIARERLGVDRGDAGDFDAFDSVVGLQMGEAHETETSDCHFHTVTMVAMLGAAGLVN